MPIKQIKMLETVILNPEWLGIDYMERIKEKAKEQLEAVCIRRNTKLVEILECKQQIQDNPLESQAIVQFRCMVYQCEVNDIFEDCIKIQENPSGIFVKSQQYSITIFIPSILNIIDHRDEYKVKIIHVGQDICLGTLIL